MFYSKNDSFFLFVTALLTQIADEERNKHLGYKPPKNGHPKARRESWGFVTTESGDYVAYIKDLFNLFCYCDAIRAFFEVCKETARNKKRGYKTLPARVILICFPYIFQNVDKNTRVVKIPKDFTISTGNKSERISAECILAFLKLLENVSWHFRAEHPREPFFENNSICENGDYFQATLTQKTFECVKDFEKMPQEFFNLYERPLSLAFVLWCFRKARVIHLEDCLLFGYISRSILKFSGKDPDYDWLEEFGCEHYQMDAETATNKADEVVLNLLFEIKQFVPFFEFRRVYRKNARYIKNVGYEFRFKIGESRGI